MTKLSFVAKGVSNSPKPISANIFHFPLHFWSLPSQTQTIFPFPTSHFFLPFSHKPKHQLPTLCLPMTLRLTNPPFPPKLTSMSTPPLPHPQPKLTPTPPPISFLPFRLKHRSLHWSLQTKSWAHLIDTTVALGSTLLHAAKRSARKHASSHHQRAHQEGQIVFLFFVFFFFLLSLLMSFFTLFGYQEIQRKKFWKWKIFNSFSCLKAELYIVMLSLYWFWHV